MTSGVNDHTRKRLNWREAKNTVNLDAVKAAALAVPPEERFGAFLRALYEQLPEEKQDIFLDDLERWLNDLDAAEQGTPRTSL